MGTDASAIQLEVTGLRELVAELRAADKKWPKELGKVNKTVSERIAADARAMALGLGGVFAHVADSVKSSAKADGVFVKLDAGTRGDAAAFGAEFGGGAHGAGNPTPRGGYTTQFPEWRGRGAGAGYFLYPSMRAAFADGAIESSWGQAVDALLAAAHAAPSE